MVSLRTVWDRCSPWASCVNTSTRSVSVGRSDKRRSNCLGEATPEEEEEEEGEEEGGEPELCSPLAPPLLGVTPILISEYCVLLLLE